MKKKLLIVFLNIARTLGFFKFSRWLTRRDLRILCYHGASLRDEHEFRGGLFIRPALFSSRMSLLADRGYPVLALSEALIRLDRDDLPSCATVITIDDGWLGTCLKMAPILKRHNFPATLYVSTYYMGNQTQVFNVAVDYVLWASGATQMNLRDVSENLDGCYEIGDPEQRAAASDMLWTYSDTLKGARARQKLLTRVSEVVGFNVAELETARLICFMNKDEAATLKDYGIDLQLHTHRHRFPADNEADAVQEIEVNREQLNGIASSQLVHFCYPSGEYQSHQFAWLEQLGIVSATTTKSGLNNSKTNTLELSRFLDSDNISEIEFEAEMSGMFELIRRCGYQI